LFKKSHFRVWKLSLFVLFHPSSSIRLGFLACVRSVRGSFARPSSFPVSKEIQEKVRSQFSFLPLVLLEAEATAFGFLSQDFAVCQFFFLFYSSSAKDHVVFAIGPCSSSAQPQ